MTREEKIAKLKRLNKKGRSTSKWKEIAEWNQKHAESLDDFVIIAGKIRHALKKRGWDQTILAKALGVSPQALTRIMKGRQNLTLQTIRMLEKVLETQLITVHTVSHGKVSQTSEVATIPEDYNSENEIFNRKKVKVVTLSNSTVEEPDEKTLAAS